MKILILTVLGLLIIGLIALTLGFLQAKAIIEAVGCVVVIILLCVVWINTLMNDPTKPEIPN